MNLNTENTQTIIERDIHCPYCNSEKALLISEIADKRSVLKIPEFDKKYLLNTIFTFGLYALVHGFPFIEKNVYMTIIHMDSVLIVAKPITQVFPILLRRKRVKRFIVHLRTRKFSESAEEFLNIRV